MIDAHTLIMEEIDKIDGPHKSVKNRIMILCPFHEDKTPSCGIVVSEDTRYDLGSFNCLGCSACGNWNKLAERLNLRQLSNMMPKGGSVSKGSLSNKMREMDGELLSGKNFSMDIMLKTLGNPATNPWPVYADWRGYPGWLVRNLGGMAAVGGRKQSINDDLKCFFPVQVGTKIVGMIQALTRKKANRLSYVSSEGDWVKSHGLFPFSFVSNMLKQMKGKKYVVLVEGPRDALRLIMEGIPALAVLGSQNVSLVKLKLLERLFVDLVIVLPDNDPAGTSMKKKIKFIKEKSDLTYSLKSIGLPKEKDKKGELIKVDPDSMDKTLMRAFKDTLKEYGCRRLKIELIQKIKGA